MHEQHGSFSQASDNHKLENCFINGAPGIGKSSLVWAWACNEAYKNSKLIVWLHYNKMGTGVMVILNKKIGISYSIHVKMDVSDLLVLAGVNDYHCC